MAQAFERVQDVLELILELVPPAGFLDDRSLQHLREPWALDKVQRELHRLRLVSRQFDAMITPLASKHLGAPRLSFH